ncbi:MFS transporter [Rhodococcus sp. 14C212]|uniref:MFS transporter n=1 Tax=Rhodococcus sp. 14C212 TaxID=2711209 RepID=UPI0013EAFD1E|nr:MFS transporter [Rhodococcus sp. 14C212]NGP07410.1 MFS transporter [Rhodococcus sp. 14C212]
MTTEDLDADQPDRTARAGLVACLGAIGITILDISKANVALPAIEQSLSPSSSQLQLIVSGFALAFALALVPSARLGDAGMGRVGLLASVGVFSLTSVLCAFAPSADLLVVCRILQGAAAGVQMAQALGFIQRLYLGRQRGRAFGAVGATLGLATAIGPTLGGLLIVAADGDSGWRLLFGSSAPAGAAVLLLAARVLPRESRARRPIELDLPGMALLTAAVLAALVPVMVGTHRLPAAAVCLCWAAAVTMGVAFVRWEGYRARSGLMPLVHPTLFAQASFRNAAAVGSAYHMGIGALFLIVPLYIQFGLGRDAVTAGLATLPFALGHTVGAMLSGRAPAKRARQVITGGLLIVVLAYVGIAVVSALSPGQEFPWVLLLMGVAGTGAGSVAALNQVVLLSEVPVEIGTSAASLGQLGQRIGSAAGIALGLSLYLTAEMTGDFSASHSFGRGIAGGVVILLIALAWAIFDARRAHSPGVAD